MYSHLCTICTCIYVYMCSHMFCHHCLYFLHPPHTHSQDVQPLIEAMDLEHAFMHILDELSGHLQQFEEEKQSGEEYQDNAELVSSRGDRLGVCLQCTCT